MCTLFLGKIYEDFLDVQHWNDCPLYGNFQNHAPKNHYVYVSGKAVKDRIDFDICLKSGER